MQVTSVYRPRSCLVENLRYGETNSSYYDTFGNHYESNGNCDTVRSGNRVTPNPWYYNITEFSQCDGIYQNINGIYGTRMTGSLVASSYNFVPIPAYTPNAYPDRPYNAALEKLYSKIRSDTDLSIDIYQIGQSVKMIRGFASALSSPIRTIAISMRSLARSRKISRSSSFISNKWLEWQYGISPSIQTINSLTGNLIETVSNPNGFLCAKARKSNFRFIKHTIPYGPSSNKIPFVVETSASKRVEIAIIYGVSDAERNALSQFTSLNPASFIYENIPFSFVLDWVVDIGSYLRSMETALLTGLDFKSGYVTDSYKLRSDAQCGGTVSNSGYGTDTVTAKSWYSEKGMNRVLLSSMPIPEPPSINISLGSNRLASLAALLRQTIR